MSDLAVTDTHALIWYATGARKKLGRRALRLFDRADAGNAAIYVPTIVLVEAAEVIQTGRVVIRRPFADWESELFGSGKYIPADLTRDVVRIADRLGAIPERGDRLIAATAVHLRCPLITRDPAIAAIAEIDLIW